MKRFKSPMTVILTLLAIVPLFIGSLIAGSTLWLPLGALIILLLIHIILGTPKKSDGAKDEVLEALDREATKAALNMPIMANTGRGGSFNYFGRSWTYVGKDARYHAGVLCWVVVLAGYFAFTILANAKIYGGNAPIAMELFLPFFLGSAALAAGDMTSYFLKGKKSVLYRVMLTAAIIIGAYFFYLGVMGLVI